jgi:hypothetical protein
MWSICFAKHGAASDLLIFNTSLAEERTVHRTLRLFMPLAAQRLVSSMRDNRVKDAQARLPKEQRRREQLDLIAVSSSTEVNALTRRWRTSPGSIGHRNPFCTLECMLNPSLRCVRREGRGKPRSQTRGRGTRERRRR